MALRLKKILILITTSWLALSMQSCSNKDISDNFINYDSSISDTTRLTIRLKTKSKEDRDIIFSTDNILQVVVEGFYEPSFINLPVHKVGNFYFSESMVVSPNKTYTIQDARLIDHNKNIVAIAPIQGSLWSYATESPLPLSATSVANKNTPVDVTFFPVAGGNAEMTGYTTIVMPSTIPFVDIEIGIEDSASRTPIAGNIEVVKESNGSIIIPSMYNTNGKFTVRIYYYTENDIFSIKVGGHTATGYKTAKDKRSIGFIKAAYDKNLAGTSLYLFRL